MNRSKAGKCCRNQKTGLSSAGSEVAKDGRNQDFTKERTMSKNGRVLQLSLMIVLMI